MSANSPISLWSRTDLRSRWRSLVLVGVLAGLTAGLAAAAYDGALRTGTALERLESRNRASDAVVFASQTSAAAPAWDRLAERPEVVSIARWRLIFGLIGDTYAVLFGPSHDGAWLNTVDRPIVTAGRMFDPTKPDEMVISDDATRGTPDDPALHLGDTLHLDTFGGHDDVPGSGPSVTLHVVGVVHTSLRWEFAGGGFVSPAFFTKYGDQIEFAENAFITLRHGSADVGELRRDASADVFAGVPVLDMHVTARRVTATTDVERAMLMVLATIIALSGLVFVGQAMARSAATIAGDAPVLRALGMSRRDLTAASVWPHLATIVAAALTTIVTAVVASRWFPVGLAAQVDPDRGIRVDVALLAVVTTLTVVLVAAEIALSGWLAAGADERRPAARASLLARLGLVRPLTAGVGMRLALEGGRRSGRGSSRSALLGAAAAVAGIVAIITLDHGLTTSLSHPEVAGVAWDVLVTPKDADTSVSGVAPSVIKAVADRPGLAESGTVGRVTTQVGAVGVPTFTIIDDAQNPPIRLVNLSGHGPTADDEIELGPSTARDLGVGIGDHVTLTDGTVAQVVGLGLFPADVHAQFDEGAWVSPKRWFSLLSSLGPDAQLSTGFGVAVRFADRSHLDQQGQALAQSLGDQVSDVEPADLPAELTNLHNVRQLPQLLAIFLTVLGVVAVGHALFSVVRRRRKDFAVLRSLGITRTGARGILAAQGTTVAVVGLIIGVPLGLLAGRAGWRSVVDRVPLTFRSPVTLVAVVLVVPITIVVANALAVIPGRSASRLEPAIVLRSE